MAASGFTSARSDSINIEDLKSPSDASREGAEDVSRILCERAPSDASGAWLTQMGNFLAV